MFGLDISQLDSLKLLDSPCYINNSILDDTLQLLRHNCFIWPLAPCFYACQSDIQTCPDMFCKILCFCSEMALEQLKELDPI